MAVLEEDERTVAEGRTGLGEAAFAAAWAEGRAMSLEEALAYALSPGQRDSGSQIGVWCGVPSLKLLHERFVQQHRIVPPFLLLLVLPRRSGLAARTLYRTYDRPHGRTVMILYAKRV